MRVAALLLLVVSWTSGCRGHGDAQSADTPRPSDVADEAEVPLPPAADDTSGGVHDPLRATHIAVGGGTSYARMSDGTIRAWGDGSVFALGRPEEGPVGGPVEVPGVEHATGVFAGGHDEATACATLEGGQTTCWGSHWAFPLERKSKIEGSPPTLVPGLAGAREITIGSSFGCALMDEGTVKCWGKVPGWPPVSIREHRGPTPVEGLANIVAIRSSWSHACALDEEGRVWCWGKNRSLQVAPAEGSPAKLEAPKAVEGIEGAIALATADDFTCALIRDGGLKCWGGTPVGGVSVSRGRILDIGLGAEVLGLSHAGGSLHVCAIVEGGGARCVGYNRNGQLGVDTGSWSDVFVAVPGFIDALSIATSATHTCALTKDGEVSCWGGNGKGGLGDGTFSDHVAPSRVVGLLDKDLAPAKAPQLVDDGPFESYEGLPADCQHPTLTLEIPGRDRTTFEVKSAFATVPDETVTIQLRDHGFDVDKTSWLEEARGDRMRIELELSQTKRVREQGTNADETTWVERQARLKPGTYLTFPGWLAADSPYPQREVKVSLWDAKGPVLIQASPVRAGEVQAVEITRIDAEWICGRFELSSAMGKLEGEFAARVWD